MRLSNYSRATVSKFTLDGGWGVDALLGRQTRLHGDLDIAAPHKDLATIRSLLAARGYRDLPRTDSWECNFVLVNNLGQQLDIHLFSFDAAGNNVYGVGYPIRSLTGTGIINGQTVRCIAPEWMVKFHTGYQVDEHDYHDVKLLCQNFGLPLPPDYDGFVSNKGEDILHDD